MRKVHARFDRMIDAKKALDTLKDLGYGNGYLDASDNFFSEYSDEINFAGTNTGPSLSGLVLMSRSSTSDIDKAPLVAADPMVSGFGRHGYLAESLSANLVISIDETNAAPVREVIQRMGGNLF